MHTGYWFYSKANEESLKVTFDESGLNWLYSGVEGGENVKREGRVNLSPETLRDIRDLIRTIEEFNLPF